MQGSPMSPTTHKLHLALSPDLSCSALNWASPAAHHHLPVPGYDCIRKHQTVMPSWTVQKIWAYSFYSPSFHVFLTSIANTLSFAPLSLSPAAGWGTPLPGLWQEHQQVVGKFHPGLQCSLLCLFPLSLAFSLCHCGCCCCPNRKKRKGLGGCNRDCPFFLTLVRKPSLLLCGE